METIPEVLDDATLNVFLIQTISPPMSSCKSRVFVSIEQGSSLHLDSKRL